MGLKQPERQPQLLLLLLPTVTVTSVLILGCCHLKVFNSPDPWTYTSDSWSMAILPYPEIRFSLLLPSHSPPSLLHWVSHSSTVYTAECSYQCLSILPVECAARFIHQLSPASHLCCLILRPHTGTGNKDSKNTSEVITLGLCYSAVSHPSATRSTSVCMHRCTC